MENFLTNIQLQKKKKGVLQKQTNHSLSRPPNILHGRLKYYSFSLVSHRLIQPDRTLLAQKPPYSALVVPELMDLLFPS